MQRLISAVIMGASASLSSSDALAEEISKFGKSFSDIAQAVKENGVDMEVVVEPCVSVCVCARAPFHRCALKAA